MGAPARPRAGKGFPQHHSSAWAPTTLGPGDTTLACYRAALCIKGRWRRPWPLPVAADCGHISRCPSATLGQATLEKEEEEPGEGVVWGRHGRKRSGQSRAGQWDNSRHEDGQAV